MKFSRKSLLAGIAVAFLTTVLATTFGPFPISALGKAYAFTGYATDSEAEFEGAMKIASLYLSPILNTPAKIKKAIEEDSVRVSYSDGQIAEFKIVSWPSTLPLRFVQKVATATQQTKPIGKYGDGGCEGGRGQPTSIPTGYWGSSVNNSNGTVYVTGFWVSTGTYTYYAPTNKYCP